MDRFQIGHVTIHRIEEWQGTFAPPSYLFSGYTPEGWDPHAEEFAPEYYDPATGQLYAFLQSWVLDTGKERILFDTGAGNDKDRPNIPVFSNLQTDFLGNLARAGYQPEDIDVVVCSHIHIDHVGWNTRLVDGRWEPTFRNARYVLPLADRAYWDPEDAAVGPAGLGRSVNAGMYEDSVAPIVAAGRAEWAEPGFEVAEGLTLHACPGHTPGSMMLEVAGKDDSALFVGDVVHHPAQIYRPEWNSVFCEAPDQARDTRRQVLDLAADRGALLVPAHFGGTHMARVLREGTGFRPVLGTLGLGGLGLA